MRYLVSSVCVLALGVLPMVGCSDEETTGGTGGVGGEGGMGGMPECQSPDDCEDREECTTDDCAEGVCEYTQVADGTACADNNECAVGQCASGTCELTPVTNGTACGDDAGTCQDGSCQVACTEQGILDAVAAGGGPYTFDCDGPTTLVTTETVLIDTDVVLDGGGNLTLDGNNDHPILVSPAKIDDTPPAAELRGFRVTGAPQFLIMNVGYAIYNAAGAALTLTDCTVSDNGGNGIENQGATLTLLNSTVSDNGFTNLANYDGGILWVTNSTISGGEAGISNGGEMTISNSTVVSENLAVRTPPPGDVPPSTGAFATTFTNTIVAGRCEGDIVSNVTSNGHNIESPGNTCGFDQAGDQPGVTEAELNLGPLADNGGPTMTRKPGDGGFGEGSFAIDQIPETDCRVDTDQRGEPRPETGGTMCDVGSVEVQP